MKKTIFFFAAASILFIAAGSVWSATQKPYHNDLSRADWTKYGVNPWKLDTDGDGFSDAWEVKNDYCPTSQDRISLADTSCQKGKINFTAQTYAPPAKLKDVLPREIKRFGSCTLMRQQIAALPSYYGYGTIMRTMTDLAMPAAETKASTPAAQNAGEVSDYSKTNVQVEGVDEGDIVKTDGKYVYTFSNNNLVIASAVPAESAKILSKTEMTDIDSVREIYINGDYALVIGNSYFYNNYPVPLKAGAAASNNLSISRVPYPYYGGSYVTAQIWNVAHREKPVLVRSLDFAGDLLTSRLTGGYAYLVLHSQPQYRIMDAKTISARTIDIMPSYRDIRGTDIAKRDKISFKQLDSCADVDYIYPIRRADYMEIVALPLDKPLNPIGTKIVFGAGQEVYASTENLYVAATENDYWWYRPVSEKTEFYKFHFNKENITLVASQSVPGHILNQFSMDEYKGNFRIATTLGNNWNGDVRQNNIYVFDKDLNRIGWYENFGEGEKIYAARFMGERAYVVTFQETDPLFVFDLSDARAPKLLGELKMPGYSTYLHPYDATHLIGIGKNAITNTSSPGFAWYQGLKLGLFDVTDPAHPVEMFKTEIGDRGTDSLALNDHHAFLFSKEKNLLVIPVTVAQLMSEQKNSTSTDLWEYGQTNYQGLFVYDIDLINGFSFKGGITHFPEANSQNYVNYYGQQMIKRSLYIGDNLYALSEAEMTIHHLSDLTMLGRVKLSNLSDNPVYYLEAPAVK